MGETGIKGIKLGKCWGGKVVEETRVVQLNATERTLGHDVNSTRTTKYTLLTYWPKALFEQYRRIANVYFTLVAILSLTVYSPVRPWTTWTPLVIVMGVSMVKEAIEDYKRYKGDQATNHQETDALDPETGEFRPVVWKRLYPGQIVRCKKDEFIPADLVFLGSSDPENTCYVETMNLDGETNLKIKKSLDECKDLSVEDLSKYQGSIECEAPNTKLYQFAGNLLVGPPEQTNRPKVAVQPSAVILRGCSLRNTAHIYGVIIYAGHDTKVFMNSTEAPSKRSIIERRVDYVIMFMFACLFSFCLTGAVFFTDWLQKNFEDHWYMLPGNTGTVYNPEKPGATGVGNFITGFILYGYLIPISLYVSIEMVKIVQSMVFIAQDRDMYHKETDTPAVARTSNLNEDLGMVKTVLSDKTGTLTMNMMDFFKCSIAGTSYGAGITEIERSNADRRGQILQEIDTAAADPYREKFFNFYDKKLMDQAWTKQERSPEIEMFFRMLAVCHTVVPDGPAVEDEIKYEAESPDEAALVVAAKVMGFFFCKRSNTTVTVREKTASGTHDVEYELLNVLEFNSTRKRMSVIVRDSRGKLLLFCKGADTVIYARLDNKNPLNLELKKPTLDHMEEYGNSGLRTLCLSYKELDSASYEKWQVQWEQAKTALTDRELKMDELSEEMEHNLCLLGCTAIEDRLQEGVSKCIKQMADAGIRLWVLTGDKLETAINIGFACSLITEEMRQFIITANFADVEALELEGDLDGASVLANTRVEEQLTLAAANMQGEAASMDCALIIDGKALTYALSGKQAKLFISCAERCKAVLCCRVSPLQKAQVTGLVKKQGDVTLAIGDGANDVGMIQSAHIGVGISGQEGRQAVMASDFAIAQFRYLTPLLMVHGRWSYKRITRMINFFLYKNMLFGVTLFCYNGFTLFSGQYMYSDVYMTLFNVIFTSLTPIIIGMFDKDVDKSAGIQYPQLYGQGQRNEYFTAWAIMGWLATSLMQCLLLTTFVLVGNQSDMILFQQGHPSTMYATGVLLFTTIIITLHWEVISILEQWTWIHHLSIWGSQAIWWVFLCFFSIFPLGLSADLYHLFIGIVGGSAHYWLYCLLLPVMAILPDFFYRAVRRWVAPAPHEVVGEIQWLARKEGRNLSQMPQPVHHVPEDTNATVVFRMMGEEKKHTGYVPEYDPQSKFYNQNQVATKHKDKKRDDGGLRNPVLDKLTASAGHSHRTGEGSEAVPVISNGRDAGAASQGSGSMVPGPAPEPAALNSP
eukprot:gene16456-22676_t